MSDLISKSALINEIIEEAETRILDMDGTISLGDMKEWVECQPTVDAVAVLRCRDCAHWGTGSPVETESVNVGVFVDKDELIKALKYDREQYGKGCMDGLNANKWIPVSERLPDDEEKVLVCTEYKYKSYDGTENIVRRITCAMYESGNMMCEDSDYSWDYECRGEYDEDKDDYHTLEGWFEITIMEHEEWTAVGLDRKVTAWMPLPEPFRGEGAK